MKSFRLTSLLLVALIVPSANELCAYGPIGHQIVGAIADARLANTPTAEKVSALIDGFTLEKAAVIADEIKGWDKRGADDPGIFHYSSRPRIDAQLHAFWHANPPTKDHNSTVPSHHWFHYTDVPVLHPEKYADGATGRSQWDIVHISRMCIAVLQGEVPEDNPRKITKSIAVILLAHYLGDIHQPLHVGAEYFSADGKPIDPDKDKTKPSLEDQGGNTLMLHLKSPDSAARKDPKLHGFWDNDAVMLNLPAFPETMPKDERRARSDAARIALVQELATKEPPSWKLPATTKPGEYPEAWANEILPLAREAHERLRFVNVTEQHEGEEAFAAGTAEEKQPSPNESYSHWAGHVVREELHKGGWRLADLLTEALK